MTSEVLCRHDMTVTPIFANFPLSLTPGIPSGPSPFWVLMTCLLTTNSPNPSQFLSGSINCSMPVQACVSQPSIFVSPFSPLSAAVIHSTLLHLISHQRTISAHPYHAYFAKCFLEKEKGGNRPYRIKTCPNDPVGFWLMNSSVLLSWTFM